MFKWFENLPVEFVGTKVMGLLVVKDIVMLERACGSKASHQHFMNMILYSPPVVLPYEIHDNISSLEWFATKSCKLHSLTIYLPSNNAFFYIKNLQVDSIDLRIESDIDIQHCQPLFESDLRYKVKSIDVTAAVVDKEVMEQLSIFTENIIKLQVEIDNSNWLTVDILSRWKLKEIILVGTVVNKVFITLIAQTCTELTSLSLNISSTLLDDFVMNIVAQHCTKLEKLKFSYLCTIRYHSLIALSERGLPLEELAIPSIPNIPTADIARHCSHALSCIRHLNTCDLYNNDQDATILIPYMKGLTRVDLDYYCDSYIPMLTQHCHKLTEINVDNRDCHVSDILSLCRANPLLQELIYWNSGFTDIALIELLHACPNLHTLDLPNETNITDIGILALSEHCAKLQCLIIYSSPQVTEAAVLQLLQRCRKLTTLEVSRSSLSKETWTQLDRNTPKRVNPW